MKEKGVVCLAINFTKFTPIENNHIYSTGSNTLLLKLPQNNENCII